MNYIKWIRKKVGHEKIILNIAGICIVNQNAEVLLQKRGDKNKWGCPGGALEIGESIEECALREVKEETGLDVKIEYLIGVYSLYFDKYPNGDEAQCITHFFKGSPVSGKLVIDQKETLELQYFKLDGCPPLVNQQHEDCLIDLSERNEAVFK